MPYKSIRLITATALMGLAFSVSAASLAGEITRADAGSDFQWKSTECRKPIPPSAASGMSETERLTTYARDIEIYIDCIQREAQRDFAQAQEDMQKAVERDLQNRTSVMNDMMLQAAKTMR